MHNAHFPINAGNLELKDNFSWIPHSRILELCDMGYYKITSGD